MKQKTVLGKVTGDKGFSFVTKSGNVTNVQIIKGSGDKTYWKFSTEDFGNCDCTEFAPLNRKWFYNLIANQLEELNKDLVFFKRSYVAYYKTHNPFAALIKKEMDSVKVLIEQFENLKKELDFEENGQSKSKKLSLYKVV